MDLEKMTEHLQDCLITAVNAAKDAHHVECTLEHVLHAMLSTDCLDGILGCYYYFSSQAVSIPGGCAAEKFRIFHERSEHLFLCTSVRRNCCLEQWKKEKKF